MNILYRMAQQGVESTLMGRAEMVLLFTFLGGEIQGYVEYSDVERFLYTKLPMTVGLITVVHFWSSLKPKIIERQRRTIYWTLETKKLLQQNKIY